MKIESQNLQLRPIHIEQIRLNGFHTQNGVVNLSGPQLECLQLLLEGKSLQEISQIHLDKNRLVSYLALKDLLLLLNQEGYVQNPLVQKYLEPPKKNVRNGIFEGLLQGEEPPRDLRQQLSRLAFFRSLNSETQNLFFNTMTFVIAPKGVRVCHQGQKQRSLFCLFAGEAEVIKDGNHLVDLNSGTIFGEAGFFLDLPRTADVVTTAKSQIVRFKYIPEVFDSLIHKEKAAKLQERIWVIHALLNSALFRELPEDCMDAIVHSGILRQVQRGDFVVKEGDLANSFFVLVQGSLEVTQMKKSIRQLKQGDCFGEVALLLNRGVRTASVSAKSNSLVLEISAQSFYQLLGANLFLACEFERLSLIRARADFERAG